MLYTLSSMWRGIAWSVPMRDEREANTIEVSDSSATYSDNPHGKQ
jgi:hypothetical protein